MGYELKRLMQQYGVSTPGMAPPPVMPVAPTAPQPLAEGADEAAQQKFAAATAAYNTAQAAHPAAMSSYNTTMDRYRPYKQEYERRLSNTPMYLGAQYNTSSTPDPVLNAPNTTSGLTAMYQQYLGRAPEAAGLQHWQTAFGEQMSPAERQQLAQAALPEIASRGMNDFGEHFYRDTGSYWGRPLNFAKGGSVAGYNVGGEVDGVEEPMDPAASYAPRAEQANNMGELEALLQRYLPAQNQYGAELTQARAAAKAETDKFDEMLRGMIQGSPQDDALSKSELYFRLAAAFGAPTRTGHISENIAGVGRELAESAKDRRASSRQKQQLLLQQQQFKTQAAKSDVDTVRSLAQQEMSDRRAAATAALKAYIDSGKPQSAAGKQALDEGLQPGTPEYQNRVKAIAQENIDRQADRLGMAAQGLTLAADRLAFQQHQGSLLSPTEVKLKTETEDMVGQTGQALENLRRVYQLIPNTFSGSIPDTLQYKALSFAGSKDPKVVNTAEMLNLLEKAALSQLKATFPGAISNDERKALLAVQGIEAKSQDERRVIIRNAYKALQTIDGRSRKRLEEINAGRYRATNTPAAQNLEE
jgi:hypothetical protein